MTERSEPTEKKSVEELLQEKRKEYISSIIQGLRFVYEFNDNIEIETRYVDEQNEQSEAIVHVDIGGVHGIDIIVPLHGDITIRYTSGQNIGTETTLENAVGVQYAVQMRMNIADKYNKQIYVREPLAPDTLVLAKERNKRSFEYVEQLSKTLGPVYSIENEYVDPRDRTSDSIIYADMGESHVGVKIVVPLDGDPISFFTAGMHTGEQITIDPDGRVLLPEDEPRVLMELSQKEKEGFLKLAEDKGLDLSLKEPQLYFNSAQKDKQARMQNVFDFEDGDDVTLVFQRLIQFQEQHPELKDKKLLYRYVAAENPYRINKIAQDACINGGKAFQDTSVGVCIAAGNPASKLIDDYLRLYGKQDLLLFIYDSSKLQRLSSDEKAKDNKMAAYGWKPRNGLALKDALVGMISLIG